MKEGVSDPANVCRTRIDATKVCRTRLDVVVESKYSPSTNLFELKLAGYRSHEGVDE